MPNYKEDKSDSKSRFSNASFSDSRLAASEIQKVCEWIKRDKHFLIFTGNPGIGKTHFCYSFFNYLTKDIPYEHTIRFWNDRSLFTRIRKQMDMVGDYLDGLHSLIDDHLVIVDDLGSSGVNDWRREVLFELIDFRYESQKPTVFTSNLTEAEIKEQMGSRFHSRFFSRENTFIHSDSQDMRLTE